MASTRGRSNASFKALHLLITFRSDIADNLSIGLSGSRRFALKIDEEPSRLRQVACGGHRLTEFIQPMSKYLTEPEAADYLRLAPKTLTKWRHAGRGPKYHKFGGAIRYALSDLEAFVMHSRGEA